MEGWATSVREHTTGDAPARIGRSPRPARRLRRKFVEYQRTATESCATRWSRRTGARVAPRAPVREPGRAARRPRAGGVVGLLKSVERFDPDRGLAFSSFAMPTIAGEIKRHFRDKTWSIRVPRRTQELHLAARAASNGCSRTSGGRRRSRSSPRRSGSPTTRCSGDGSRRRVPAGVARRAVPSDGGESTRAREPRSATNDADFDLADIASCSNGCSRGCRSASARSCGCASSRT